MEDQNLPALILIGCLFILAMAASIILFVIRHQRKMLLNEKRIQLIESEKRIAIFKVSIEAEERQKEIIAKNLHDSINPMLSSLKYSLYGHQSDFLNNNFIPENLDKDKQTIDHIIQEIRATCHDLIPANLNEFGLVKTLEDSIKAINRSKIISASFNSEKVTLDFETIPKMDQVNIYRVCMELLNNIIKHSLCTDLSLLIFSEQNKLAIEFNYNGNGITDAEIEQLSKKGLGLNSLKSRVLILNATLNYLRTTDGFAVKFHIPLSAW